jgi:hypothetical protein
MSVTVPATPSTLVRRPRGSPTPIPDEEYWLGADASVVTRPVMSSVHENMVDAWRINNHHPMWLIFDVVTPVRQFKRGMVRDDALDFPAYGPPPWGDLTETDEPPRGLMQYAPIAHQYAAHPHLSVEEC